MEYWLGEENGQTHGAFYHSEAQLESKDAGGPRSDTQNSGSLKAFRCNGSHENAGAGTVDPL